MPSRNKMTYVATFFSHFGAIRYQKLCREQGIAAHTMPVPRSLSSSCGTCVRCEERFVEPSGVCAEEIDRIVRAEGDHFVAVYEKEHTDGN